MARESGQKRTASPKTRKRAPKRKPAAPFSLGNELWKLRERSGPRPKYDDPAEVFALCVEYFEHVDSNPLSEQKVFHSDKSIVKADVEKMRPYTIAGLCEYLCIARSTWNDWREKRKDLSEVIEWADMVMERQKFEGAAAGLMNANIISRDLGLADRKDVNQKTALVVEVQDRFDDEPNDPDS